MTPQEIAIDRDYNKASDHARVYAFTFQAQVQARGMLIDSAMRKFQEFTKLPPSDSTMMKAITFAWTAISMIPGFKVASLLLKAETAEKITTATSALQEQYAKGKNMYDNAVTIDEKGGAIWVDGTDGVTELAKLDVSMGPIKELVADTKKMVVLWRRTLQFLTAEKAARLSNSTKPYPYSMESYAQQRLPDIEVYSPEEIDQIELEYLWQLIASYVKQTVWFAIAGDGEMYTQKINNTQQTTILNLFGPTAKRGKYFKRMYAPSFEAYLYSIGLTPAKIWGDIDPAPVRR